MPLLLVKSLGLMAVASATPRLLFGPTANHKDIMNETLAFLAAENDAEWSEVRGLIKNSGGGLHLRGIFHQPYCKSDDECAQAQRELAAQTERLGLRVSVEAGEGALCGAGSGVAKAQEDLQGLSEFVAAGGHITFLEVTSTFSRSNACAVNGTKQSVGKTAYQAAFYAAEMAAALKPEHIFLYDALPHYAVGTDYPANVKGYNLELGEVLTKFMGALATQNLTLDGFWMDCPYDYSINYPVQGKGFEKIAAAVKLVKGMGLQVGKTFNYQAGGGGKKTPTDPDPGSDEEFYNGTMSDFEKTTALVPSSASAGHALDYVMVESWYRHPTEILPESAPHTLAYTTRAVLRQADAVEARVI